MKTKSSFKFECLFNFDKGVKKLYLEHVTKKFVETLSRFTQEKALVNQSPCFSLDGKGNVLDLD